jgi:PEP-CTERM motif
MIFCAGRRKIDCRRNLRKLVLPCLLAGVALAFPTGGARAGFTTYFGIDQGNGTPPTTPNLSLAARTSFVSALGTVGVENFESYGVGTPPASLSFTGSGVTATATYAAGESINNVPDNGAFATSGTHYLDSQGVRDDHLVFSSPVAGIGFYVTDISDGGTAPDQISVVATLAGGGTKTFTTSVTTGNSNANVLFFGVVGTDPSELFSGVEILNTFSTEGDVHGIDDITVGLTTAVPEPSSLLMLGIGLAGLAGNRWRRRARRSAA